MATLSVQPRPTPEERPDVHLTFERFGLDDPAAVADVANEIPPDLAAEPGQKDVDRAAARERESLGQLGAGHDAVTVRDEDREELELRAR